MISGKQEAVEEYLESRISFDELVERIGEEDAESIRASKQMLEENEELVKALSER